MPYFHLLVDCTWGDWDLGECSATCAGGIRIDTRNIATEAMHGGFCDPEGDVRREICNTQACPRMLKFQYFEIIFNLSELILISVISSLKTYYYHSYHSNSL